MRLQFNVAESVNFAAPDWFPWGRMAVEAYRLKRPTVFPLEEILTKCATNISKINDINFVEMYADIINLFSLCYLASHSYIQPQ